MKSSRIWLEREFNLFFLRDVDNLRFLSILSRPWENNHFRPSRKQIEQLKCLRQNMEMCEADLQLYRLHILHSQLEVVIEHLQSVVADKSVLTLEDAVRGSVLEAERYITLDADKIEKLTMERDHADHAYEECYDRCNKHDQQQPLNK